MNRFYIPNTGAEETVIFSSEQTKHIRDVLRLKKGERMLVFAGTGNEYEIELARISPSGRGENSSEKIRH